MSAESPSPTPSRLTDGDATRHRELKTKSLRPHADTQCVTQECRAEEFRDHTHDSLELTTQGCTAMTDVAMSDVPPCHDARERYAASKSHITYVAYV